jgi:hypothetical protein
MNPVHGSYYSIFSSCSAYLAQTCRLTPKNRETAEERVHLDEYDWCDLETVLFHGS